MYTPTDAHAVGTVLEAADALLHAGRGTAAVRLLEMANRVGSTPQIEERLVTARHEASSGPADAARCGGARPARAPDFFGGVTGLPTVVARELTPALLASAIEHHGALHVRGLLDPTPVATLRDEVRRAFAAADAFFAGAAPESTSPRFVPFEPDAVRHYSRFEGAYSRGLGALLAADTPRVLFLLVEALRASGLDRVAGAHLGEYPILSAKKTTLRSARADAAPLVLDALRQWHQDGAFMGPEIRTVNAWIALTPCGRDAPGLDLHAGPLRELVPAGTEGAMFHWSVSDAEADRLRATHVVRPELDAGDVLLFDHLTLHRTAIAPDMTEERVAIETWLFAPSTYPAAQVPLAL